MTLVVLETTDPFTSVFGRVRGNADNLFGFGIAELLWTPATNIPHGERLEKFDNAVAALMAKAASGDLEEITDCINRSGPTFLPRNSDSLPYPVAANVIETIAIRCAQKYMQHSESCIDTLKQVLTATPGSEVDTLLEEKKAIVLDSQMRNMKSVCYLEARAGDFKSAKLVINKKRCENLLCGPISAAFYDNKKLMFSALNMAAAQNATRSQIELMVRCTFNGEAPAISYTMHNKLRVSLYQIMDAS